MGFTISDSQIEIGESGDPAEKGAIAPFPRNNSGWRSVVININLYNFNAAAMKHTLLFILALLFTLSLSAQTTISKAEMYEDFDQFVEIIKTYNAQIEARKLLTGYDMVAEIQKERAMINQIEYWWDFYKLMRRCLYKTLDVHARLCTQYYQVPERRYAPGQSFYDSAGVTCFSQLISSQYKEFKKKIDSISYMDEFLSMNFYLNGKYYEYGTYKFIHKRTKDTLELINFEIVECKGEPVEEWFEHEMLGYLDGANVSWYFREKKYFGKWINIPKIFKARDMSDGREYLIKDSFNLHMNGHPYAEIPKKIEKHQESSQDRAVRYFKKGHVLYIYTKFMFDPENHVADSIKLVGRNKRIDKVVIDVRGNRGGGDQMWYNMLSAIVKDTLKWDYRLCLNDNEQVRNFMRSEYPHINLDSEYRSVSYPLLGGKRVLMPVDTVNIIEPDSNSLGYTGKIYLLQDAKTYSSGHSLTSIARMIPQLVSVGMPTGNLAGLGFNPWLFQLKNSKFTFSIETGIDLSGVKTLEDIFQDRPEIEVYPTFDEYIQYYHSYNYYFDTHDKDFLYNYDYLFKYIMNLKH